MPEPSTIGKNLRRLRNDRGLSQEGLAQAAGVSVSMVTKLEQGRKQEARLTSLSKLAKALDTEVSQLIDKRERLGATRDGGSVLALRDALLSPSLLPGVDPGDDGGEPTPIEELTASVDAAWRAYRSGNFGALVAMLPGLIGEARITHSSVGAPAVPSLAQSYEIASALLTQIGRTDLGAVAAERAVIVAHMGNDQLLWAWMHAAYSWVLLHQDRYAEAEQVAAGTAEQIEPRFRDGDLEVAVWGNLLLTAVAPRVAQEEDPDEYLRLAGASAERIGRRVEMYRSWFDAPSVAMQATYGYSMLKEPGRALEAAKKIRPPAPGRPGDLWGISWGAHLMDRAAAHLDAGHLRTSRTTLLEAREVSPVWFRHQRIAHQVAADIRERETRLSPETRLLVRALELDE